MSVLLQDRLIRVRELLKTVRHVAIATVNSDGSPHNTPVCAGFDGELRMYWVSNINSLHSQNIDRSGQAFVAVFNSLENGDGLYIQATARQLEPGELAPGLKVCNDVRTEHGRDPLNEEFLESSEQQIYCAIPEKLWVNLVERDDQDRIIRDYRHEISLNDLTMTKEN